MVKEKSKAIKKPSDYTSFTMRIDPELLETIKEMAKSIGSSNAFIAQRLMRAGLPIEKKKIERMARGD